VLTYVYFRELRSDEMKDNGLNHHRFVLFKRARLSCPLFDCSRSGLIPRRDLLSFRGMGSPLQGHPHVLSTPWVETNTGSLGQGFSVAIGMALGSDTKPSLPGSTS